MLILKLFIVSIWQTYFEAKVLPESTDFGQLIFYQIQYDKYRYKKNAEPVLCPFHVLKALALPNPSETSNAESPTLMNIHNPYSHNRAYTNWYKFHRQERSRCFVFDGL